jgi:sialic acid synthase SpsE
MKEALSCAVGFSDHSRGVHAALAARALGADIIEKHLTLDCAMDGPDHALSLDPGRFARMVKQLRDVEEALGSPEKKPSESERAGRVAGRRGIKASRNLKAGTRVALPDLVCLKPALGIEPVFLNALTGRVLVRDVSAGSPIEWEMMEKQ